MTTERIKAALTVLMVASAVLIGLAVVYGGMR